MQEQRFIKALNTTERNELEGGDMTRFKMFQSLWLVVLTTMIAVSSASAQSESENTIQGYEASEIHLTLDSGNNVLGLRVVECELCTQHSYLPAQDIVISEGAKDLSAENYPKVSGRSGTIMFDDRTKMVFEVNFWTPRGEGEVR